MSRSKSLLQFTVLVTGATSGIGLDIARILLSIDGIADKSLQSRIATKLAGRRLEVLLLGRRALHELRHLTNAEDAPIFNETNYISLDLSDSKSGEIVRDRLSELKLKSVDLLIHNAATGYYGPWHKEAPQHAVDLIQTNLISPIQITRYLFESMALVKGKVLFVSSVTSRLSTPDFMLYSATKAAVDAFARNLTLESADNVKVQVVFPGATKTGFHSKIGVKSLDSSKFSESSVVAEAILTTAFFKFQLNVSIDSKVALTRSFASFAPDTIEYFIRRSYKSKMKKPITKKPVVVPGKRRHVVVTGASQGIGLAVMKRFSGQNYICTSVDINAPPQSLPSGDMFIQADLSEQSGCEKIVNALCDRPIIDVLVLNAGVNSTSRFEFESPAKIDSILHINCISIVLLLIGLKQKRRLAPNVTVVMVSSLSRYVSYPGASVYAASKDFVHSLAASLRVALRPSGGWACCIYPGPTRTQQAFECAVDNSASALKRRMSPEEVARAVFAGVQHHHRRVIPGFRNRLLASLSWWLPSLTETAMQKIILEKLPQSSSTVVHKS